MHQQIQAHPGEIFEIPLEGNPTTGFRWDIILPPSAAGLVTLLEDTWEARASLAGAPGVQRFRFQALAPGEVTLIFKYRRPWERVQARDERIISLHIAPTS